MLLTRGVGRSLIAIARTRGLRRSLRARAELVPELDAAGGDLVLLDVEGDSGSIPTETYGFN